jgi:hypothetical protein
MDLYHSTCLYFCTRAYYKWKNRKASCTKGFIPKYLDTESVSLIYSHPQINIYLVESDP